jgi:amidohydrolase
MTRSTPEDGLRAAADRLAPRLVAWRRDLHRHPELGFEEHRTARLVADELSRLGFEVRTGLAVTGVLGLLRSSAGGRDAGVLLRADMDALPVQEVAGREYGSAVDGRMHACGHDAHTAMLLGAATLLAERRALLQRDLLVCFQPAEEIGGAKRMIEEGALDWVPVGAVFGLHVWSGFPCGTAHLRVGPLMAAQDEFTARLIGRGGHGALPHRALDPIVAAAHAIAALQTVVSRSVDPIEPAVVTVGSVHAGSAANVIPAEARLAGTLRSFDGEVRRTLRRRVREVLDGSARAAGCRLEFELREGYPAVVNDAGAVEHARRAASAVFGPANVREPAPLAAAEDFAYFLERERGAFVFLGAGNAERGIVAPHHSGEFDIDEAVLPRGAEFLARLVLPD